MKKKIIVATIILIILAIAITISVYKKSNYVGTPLEPMNNLVKVQYFDKGKYEDYKALFTDPKKAMNESQLEAFRKDNKPEDTFKYGAKSKGEVMEHMKFIQDKNDKNLGQVYYLKDVNNTKEIETTSYWMVENVNGKWLIKND